LVENEFNLFTAEKGKAKAFKEAMTAASSGGRIIGIYKREVTGELSVNNLDQMP
jgi:hypothetical protein